MRVVLNCNHSYGNDYNCPSIYNQIEHNNKRISILEQDLVVNVSSSVRLDYIKSLVKDEHLSEQAVVLKDFYSLVLADDKKVTFVISPTKSLDTLVSSIHEINETESILSKMFIDKSGTKGIFYEVKIYE